METRNDGTDEPHFSQAEIYDVRDGTINMGHKYEYETLALVSLRCLHQFQNFSIAFNANSVGAFDDVIVIAQKKDEDDKIQPVKILMLLKHKNNKTDLVKSDFLKTNSKHYSISKYYKDILKLKQSLASKSNESPKIHHRLGTLDNTYFVLFTNRPTTWQPFFKNGVSEAITFLDTSDASTKNLYTIDLSEVSTVTYNQKDEINFSVFAGQRNADNLNTLIEAEMKTMFDQFGLKIIKDIKNVTKKYIEYVVDWATGQLGDYYFLSKRDILYKLAELVFTEFELDLSEEKFDSDVCPQTCVWNELLVDKELTMVDSEDKVIKFLKVYIKDEIRIYCQNTKMWCQDLSTKDQSWFSENPRNIKLKKAMLKVVGKHGKITPSSIYKCLWFCERLPLLLKIKTMDDYNVILKTLKYCNLNLKVIILNGTKTKLNTEKLEPIPSHSFLTLSDLSPEKKQTILKQEVKLQGRSSVVLGEVIDDSLFVHFNCNAIIEILLGEYSIGVEFEPQPTYFIPRCLLKVYLEMSVLAEVTDELFLVEIHEESEEMRNTLKLIWEADNVIKFNKNDPKQIENLKVNEKPIHLVIYKTQYFLEWKESFGSTTNILKYQFTLDFWIPLCFWPKSLKYTRLLYDKLEDIFERNTANTLFNSIRLVGACPGMGKSQLLNYIAWRAPTEMWVLNVILKDHHDYYRDKKNKTLPAHLNYFRDAIPGNRDNEVTKAVFQNFANKRKVLILLDGFDEVPISCTDGLLEIISCLHQAGFPIWLTTRPHVTTDLQAKLGTISTTLTPFSLDDQKNFFYKYFNTVDANDEKQNPIEKFVEELLQAVGKNLNDKHGEFMGIPLHTKLIADVFSDELENWLTKGFIQFERRFDLLQLYGEFFKSKEKILQDKLGLAAINVIGRFRKLQQLFALKSLFSNRLLFKLDIEESIEEFQKYNKYDLQDFQQDGLTVVEHMSTGSKLTIGVHFVHRTYAEYTAVCWLIENLNSECNNSRWTARMLVHQMFREYNVNSISLKMINLMLAGDCELHKLIITGRLDDAWQLLISNPDVTKSIDDGGRSFLHMIALYGFDRRNISAWKNFLEYISECKLINMKDNFGYTALDYAILSSSYKIVCKLCEKSTKVRMAGFTVRKMGCDSVKQSILKTLLLVLICKQQLYTPMLADGDRIEGYMIDTIGLEAVPFFHRYSTKDIQHITEFISQRTYTEGLVELNIKSANEDYYYDLRYAVVFGTLLNVLDLITSEYSTGDEERFNLCTPFCFAIKHNRLEIVQLLLFYGQKVDEQCTCGTFHYPLHCAVQNGDINVVKALLSHNADLNVQDANGKTPLALALRRKNYDIAKLLSSYGASVTLKYISDYFPIFNAVEYGLSITPELLRRCGINVPRSENNNTALHIALLLRHATVAQQRRCIDGFDIFHALEKLLHIAVKAGRHEFLADLLTKLGRYNLNERNYEGQTVLHLSLDYDQNSHVQVKSADRLSTIKFLLKNGGNTNIQDKDGNTALHYLCKIPVLNGNDRKNAIELLLAYSADVNLKNNNNRSPIHEFIINNASDLAGIGSFLHNNTADVNITDSEGNTALHYLNKIPVLDENDRMNAIQLLLIDSADVNLRNNNNRSLNNASHLAGIGNFLHNNTADVNITDSEGNMALHDLSCTNGTELKSRKRKLFLDYGAKTDLKNSHGHTPSDLLKMNRTKRRKNNS